MEPVHVRSVNSANKYTNEDVATFQRDLVMRKRII